MNTDTRMGALAADLASDRYRHVVLDFDQTLFLDNSTERYLDALRPRLAAFLLVACCDWLLQVLNWFGRANYNRQRDFLRVFVCTALMPWNAWLWRRAATRLASTSMNGVLLEAVPSGKTPVVLSYGFRHVIAPILRAAGLGSAPLVCSQTGFPWNNLRSTGKPAALEALLPPGEWDNTVFVTDSDDDADIVDAISRSYVVRWGTSPPPAFEDWYLPLRYTVERKYPNSRYFTYQILLEDVALLLFAYAVSWQYAFALWWLFLSLYTVYEIGYFENDHVAPAYEARPKVSEQAKQAAPFPKIKPWAWALAFFFLGIVCARPAYLAHPWNLKWALLVDFACWFGLLAGLHVLFRIFNRRPPEKRLFLFPLLHVVKVFAFAMFVPLLPMGVLLLAAQVGAISWNYRRYRHGGDPTRFNRQALRTALFLALATPAFLVFPDRTLGAGGVRWALVLAWSGMRSLEQAQHKNMVRIIAESFRKLRGR